MLKKIWRKFCGFARAYGVVYECVMMWLAYAELLGAVSPLFGFFAFMLLAAVPLAPILGLYWLYTWICSLF